jgi:hypothetical protein
VRGLLGSRNQTHSTDRTMLIQIFKVYLHQKDKVLQTNIRDNYFQQNSINNKHFFALHVVVVVFRGQQNLQYQKQRHVTGKF